MQDDLVEECENVAGGGRGVDFVEVLLDAGFALGFPFFVSEDVLAADDHAVIGAEML